MKRLPTLPTSAIRASPGSNSLFPSPSPRPPRSRTSRATTCELGPRSKERERRREGGWVRGQAAVASIHATTHHPANRWSRFAGDARGTPSKEDRRGMGYTFALHATIFGDHYEINLSSSQGCIHRWGGCTDSKFHQLDESAPSCHFVVFLLLFFRPFFYITIYFPRRVTT